MSESEIIAFTKSPDKLFYQHNIPSRETVVEILRLCKSDRGYFTAQGWKFLFDNFGIDGIMEMDAESCWLKHLNKTVWIRAIYCQALFAGYNPISNQYGDYDEMANIFITLSGVSSEIDWAIIENL